MIKELMREMDLEIIKQEIAILSEMDHPNIVKYIESYEDDKYLYIVMEYVEGA